MFSIIKNNIFLIENNNFPRSLVLPSTLNQVSYWTAKVLTVSLKALPNGSPINPNI